MLFKQCVCGFIVLKMIFKAIKFLANLKKVRRKGSLNSVCGGFIVLKRDLKEVINMDFAVIELLKGERFSLMNERISAMARQDRKRMTEIDREIKIIDDTLARIQLDKVKLIASKLEKLNDSQLDVVSQLVDDLIKNSN